MRATGGNPPNNHHADSTDKCNGKRRRNFPAASFRTNARIGSRPAFAGIILRVVQSNRLIAVFLHADWQMSRITCYLCFWPKALCWCQSITPMATLTKFVFLMHPKEFKREKAATGRLTHLCLTNSEIRCGIEFDRELQMVRAFARESDFGQPTIGGHSQTPRCEGTSRLRLACVITRRCTIVPRTARLQIFLVLHRRI